MRLKKKMLERLRQGEICIDFQYKDLELIRKICKKAFPLDEDAFNLDSFKHHTEGCRWIRKLNCSEFIAVQEDPGVRSHRAADFVKKYKHPKLGDKVEVRDSTASGWSTRIYIGPDTKNKKHLCVSGPHEFLFCDGGNFKVESWVYMRPIVKTVIIFTKKQIAIKLGINVNSFKIKK